MTVPCVVLWPMLANLRRLLLLNVLVVSAGILALEAGRHRAATVAVLFLLLLRWAILVPIVVAVRGGGGGDFVIVLVASSAAIRASSSRILPLSAPSRSPRGTDVQRARKLMLLFFFVLVSSVSFFGSPLSLPAASASSCRKCRRRRFSAGAASHCRRLLPFLQLLLTIEARIAGLKWH